ncbi:MAG: hypothetical protein KDH09_09220 [Chrysiogenetes bacterium]|nr:hypothetical protein [Chrysiogenetes bacterium]
MITLEIALAIAGMVLTVFFGALGLANFRKRKQLHQRQKAGSNSVLIQSARDIHIGDSGKNEKKTDRR